MLGSPPEFDLVGPYFKQVPPKCWCRVGNNTWEQLEHSGAWPHDQDLSQNQVWLSPPGTPNTKSFMYIHGTTITINSTLENCHTVHQMEVCLSGLSALRIPLNQFNLQPFFFSIFTFISPPELRDLILCHVLSQLCHLVVMGVWSHRPYVYKGPLGITWSNPCTSFYMGQQKVGLIQTAGKWKCLRFPNLSTSCRRLNHLNYSRTKSLWAL